METKITSEIEKENKKDIDELIKLNEGKIRYGNDTKFSIYLEDSSLTLFLDIETPHLITDIRSELLNQNRFGKNYIIPELKEKSKPTPLVPLNIEKLIINSIYQFQRENRGNKPSVILIHPETCQKLKQELAEKYGSFVFDQNSKLMLYQNIKICRSIDINENIIKVY